MKTPSIVSQLFRGSLITAVILSAATSMSCMTTYDSAGRPVQSVDPAVAIAGAAAAGLVGYAIANDNNHSSNHYYHGGGYYRPRPRPYYGGHGGYHRPGPYHRY